MDQSDILILHKYSEDAYLQYAMATVKDRALSQVQDGQLPVQRRILYDMWKLGLLKAEKPVKSARVVGDVLGKYHPHGDTAAYGSMVRIAQDFSLRYPLISGQGNFGSRDGDNAAAMRYTEAKLAPIAELLLSELDLDTVDFMPNYDGSEIEPRLLPARLPFTLLNGSLGIAVGMASSMPSHNLREVADAAIAVIKNPNITLDELLQILPGPDFPDGGQLISSLDDIKAAYVDGQGSPLRLRARWRKEDLARGQWKIIVYEMPYQVSVKRILEQVDTLTNPLPKQGKKTITQQQATLKQAALSLLDKMTDESDKDEKIRLVIYPKSSKQSPEELMAFLFANTDLENSVSMNMNVIGLDGNPKNKGLKDMLGEWAQFRFDTVMRRTRFQLKKTKDRIHILEGRSLIYLNVDEVIKLIRESDDPKEALMTTYALSEIQANDILEMRLRQLARLEGFKIEKELEDARKEAARLESLIADEKAMKRLIIKEIEADRDKFGDDRRTLIQPEARAASGSKAILQNVVDEPCTVILSKNLFIRRLQGHDVLPENLTYKEGDGEFFILRTRTSMPVIFMDNTGRVYSVTAADLPSGRGDGSPLTTLIELQAGARVVQALAGDLEAQYVFAGEKGYGFISALKNLVARPKAGKAFLTLEEGENPMPPVLLPPEGTPSLATGASNGKLLVFPLSEVKTLEKGGKGVMLMVLADDEKLSCLKLFEGEVFTGVSKLKSNALNVEIKGADLEKYVGHRARKGAYLPKKAILIS